MFFGLEKVGSARQMDLFSPVEKAEASPLYKAIDALNKRYGKGKVFSARHSLTLGLARSNRGPRLRGGYAQGLGAMAWHMKRQKIPKSRQLVGAAGFEPTTTCAQGRCATRLRYAP